MTQRADGVPVDDRLAAYAPTVREPQLPRTDVGYAVEDTAIGRLLLAVREDGRLVASAFVPAGADEDAVLGRLAARVSARVLRRPGDTDTVRRQLQDYLAGRRRDFDVDVDLSLAGGFQAQVLSRLRTVGYGDRTTYGALAAAIGRPRASRAVGAALGANPVCVVLPCHRVVAASGALTGYAGGLDAKRRLLELETSGAPTG